MKTITHAIVRLDLKALVRRMVERDERLNDTFNDGRNARPPDGDDYNDLYNDVFATLTDLINSLEDTE